MDSTGFAKKFSFFAVVAALVFLSILKIIDKPTDVQAINDLKQFVFSATFAVGAVLLVANFFSFLFIKKNNLVKLSINGLSIAFLIWSILLAILLYFG